MVKNIQQRKRSDGKKGATNSFHAFLVEPLPGFVPDDWRQQPCGYKIVSYEGPKKFRGRADAWLFMQNKTAIVEGYTHRWAICVN